eukprot:2793799-Prymnesium_polylepis.1
MLHEEAPQRLRRALRDHLRTRSTANLTEAVRAIPDGLCCDDTQGKPFIPWAPTVDGVLLPLHPFHQLTLGKLTNVSILHGTNLDEGASFEQIAKDASVAALEDAWKGWYGRPAVDELASLYLNNMTYPGEDSRAWWAAQRSLTDQNFACGARALSEHHGAVAPVYQYLFQPSSLKVRSHASELAYVFLSSKLTGEDRQLGEQMATAWATFAAVGDPGAAWSRFVPSADGPFTTLDVAKTGGIGKGQGYRKAACTGFFDDWARRALAPDTVEVQ